MSRGGEMKTGEIADRLFQYLGHMLYDPANAKLDVDALPKEFQDLGRGLAFFASMLDEQRKFATELARGNLGMEPPSPENELASHLKSLHASLRHLTWQTQRVAQGDYKQRVDFMGDFADAFNMMVMQLDEQRTALLNEVEESKQKTRALEQSVSFFEAITKNAPQWIIVLDPQTTKLLFMNQTAADIFEANNPLFQHFRPWLEEQAGLILEQEDSAEPSRLATEVMVGHKTWYLSVAVYPMLWRQHEAVAFIITDQSEEHLYMQELESVAYQDALTNVTSRHYGMKILHDWISDHQEFCICFVDMDNLKYVNDTYGHVAGDDYIVSVANLLSSFSEDALVSRLGGDEFMVLQKGWTDEQTAARLDELRQQLIEQPVVPEDSYVRSISYGVVHVAVENTMPAGELLGMADDRMYLFKRANKKQRKK